MTTRSDKPSTAASSVRDADYARLHEFRYAIRAFLSFSESAARAAGLDPKQHQLLLTVKARSGEHGITISEAAERMFLKHHSTVELVDRAYRNGLLVRMRDENDRRVVRLLVTEKGQAILSELSAHHLNELRSAGPRLVTALQAILKSLEEADAAD